VFAERGSSALVFRGDDGLDELTVSTTSSVWRVTDAGVEASTLDPTRFGISNAPVESLRGGDRAYNAAVVRALLAGEERGPIRDAVLLNAASALVALDDAAGGATTLEDGIADGLERATTALDSGAAGQALDKWVAATQSRAS
jgi:anthranilate phosphoribosyltransferase